MKTPTFLPPVRVVEAGKGLGYLVELHPPTPGSLYLSLDDPRRSDTLGGMKSTSKPETFVAYVRVSTQEQGRSGLGLEAQEAAVRGLVEARGGRLLELVTEVASGDNDYRPELGRAVALAVRTGATLVVAKLDRLARAVAKVATLLRDGLKVRVADCPEASTLELHLRATIAEEERRLISQRTKEALEAARRRGVKLGSARPGHWDGNEDARARGQRQAVHAAATARKEALASLLEQARPVVEGMRGSSLREIAAALQGAGVLTSRGCEVWTATGVKRLLQSLATVSV
jgi:DNA invertase Pin-like site-specific DNA recombinase